MKGGKGAFEKFKKQKSKKENSSKFF